LADAEKPAPLAAFSIQRSEDKRRKAIMVRRGNEQQGREHYRIPRVEILEDGESVTLRAEMPGVAKEDFDIGIDGDELTVLGKRSPVDSELRLLHGESGRGDFLRTFSVGDQMDPSNVEANVDRGILTLTIHKKKEVLPRKISINVE
jgi:HSP20 family molecular chaperone IbpA